MMAKEKNPRTEGAFGAVLERLRREQGFDSPYSFYKKRGGRKTFGLSFPNYLKFERGRSLPRPERVLPLIGALGLDPATDGARELVRSYLRELLGGLELLELLVPAAEPDPAPASWLLAENAARQAVSQRAFQLSLEQYALLGRDEKAYACHAVLANTEGWMELSELARALGRDKAAVEAGVKSLVAAGLVERVQSKVRGRLAGRFVTPPAPTPALASVYAALQRHREGWRDKNGRVLQSPYLILRASRAKFARYFQHLADVVSLSAVYGDVKPGPDSEIYLVEGKVTRLFPAESSKPLRKSSPAR